MIYRNRIYTLFFSLSLLVSVTVLNAMDVEKSNRRIVSERKPGVLVGIFGSQDMADKASVGMQLFGTATVLGLVNYLKDSPVVVSVGGSANLNHKEMNTIILVSGGLLGLGLLGGETLSKVAKSLSWRVPLYGLLIAGIYSRSFEKITGMVPFIGSALAEDNKIAKGLLIIGGGVLLHSVLDHVGKKTGAYLFGDEGEGEEEG